MLLPALAGAQGDDIEIAQQLLLPGQQKAVASIFQYLPESIGTVFTLYTLKVIEHINEIVPSQLLSLVNSLWIVCLPFIELFAPLIALPFAILTAPIQAVASVLLLPGDMVKGLADVLLGSCMDPVIAWLSYINMSEDVFTKSLHNLLSSIAFPVSYLRDLIGSLFTHPMTGLLNLMLAPIELIPSAIIACFRIPASLVAFIAMAIMLPVVTLAAPIWIMINVCLLPVDLMEVSGISMAGAVAGCLAPANLLKSLTAVRMLPATIDIFIDQLVLSLCLAPIQLIIDMLGRLAGRSIPAPLEVLE